jgi:hypothetical protein
VVKIGAFEFIRRQNGSIEINVSPSPGNPEQDVSVVMPPSGWAALVSDLSGTPGPRTFELAKALHD